MDNIVVISNSESDSDYSDSSDHDEREEVVYENTHFMNHVEVEEYKKIDVPDLWQIVSEGNRYPVRYIDTDRLLGDFAFDWFDEEWVKVPPRDHEYIQAEFDAQNLYYSNTKTVRKKKSKNISITEAISDAKKGLSEQLDVLEENIEIIIKG